MVLRQLVLAVVLAVQLEVLLMDPSLQMVETKARCLQAGVGHCVLVAAVLSVGQQVKILLADPALQAMETRARYLQVGMVHPLLAAVVVVVAGRA